MSYDKDFDVIIIGSGAGGGTLAHRLSGSGKKVLLLERGGFLRREPDNWDSKAVFLDGRYHAEEAWLDRDGHAFHPGAHYFVGGNTQAYGAVLFRMRERDFGVVRHHGGVSPAWPISYADLEPYYAEAERLYAVHGQRGEDPTEPPAAGPYPHPPVSHEPRIAQLDDDLRRAGLHPFHLPIGIRLDEADPASSVCVRCAKFDGFPCLVDGKADADIMCVRPALRRGGVRLVTGAKVERLETDASGRTVTRVVVDRDGVRETYRGHIVVVSAGAVNSAALLLRSASEQHPEGLANASGVVGRHYMCHLNSAVIAISKDPNPTVFQKTLGVNDFYDGAPDWEFPLGHFQMLAKSDKNILRGGAPPFVPGYALDYVARHALDFWVTTEDLPVPENRVTIDRLGRIRVSYRDTNAEAHRRLLRKLESLLGHLGAHQKLIPNTIARDGRIPLEGVAHQCGTVRFGEDRATSALDVTCKAHDVDNLYVVDTSFFPSSSAVNPALTAMANALRVGDILLARLGATATEQPAAEVVA
jgi:choline dehydrogenase-like flavoprotein